MLRSAGEPGRDAGRLARARRARRRDPRTAAGRRPTCTPSPRPGRRGPAREETRGSHWREDFPERDDDALARSPGRPARRRRHRLDASRDGASGRDVPLPPDPATRSTPRSRPGRRGARRARARRGPRRRGRRHVRGDGPGGQHGHGRLRRPRPTAWSPGCRSPRRCSTSCPAARPTFDRTRADGDRVGRGDVLLDRDRARPATCSPAERTALNLLCHLSGVATLTRALGRRRRRHGAARPRHPQDHAGPAGAGEVRRAVRRRRQPPDGAVGRGAGEGQPRGRRRAAWPRRSRAVARACPGCRSRSRSTPLGQAGRGGRGRRRPRAARQHDARRDARGRASRPRPAAPGSRPAAGCTLDSARAVAETGVDFLVGRRAHALRARPRHRSRPRRLARAA